MKLPGRCFLMMFSLICLSVEIHAQQAQIPLNPLLNVNAQVDLNKDEQNKESLKQELKFPGTPGIEMNQQVDIQMEGAKSSGNIVGVTNDAVYSRTEVKAKLDFNTGDLKISPWTKERLELRFNFNLLPLSITSGTNKINDIDTVLARSRNRFYMGLDMSYKVSDTEFSLNNELRIENDLKPSQTSDLMRLRYAPIIGVNGKYANGLSLSVLQSFGFTFNPSQIYEYEMEGWYKLGYDFWKSGDYKVGIGIEEYLRWRKDKLTSVDVRERLDSDLFAGFQFALGNFKPSAGFSLWYDQSKQEKFFSNDLVCGFKTGLEYIKGAATVNMSYRGGQNLIKSESAWLSEIVTAVKIKY